MSELLDELYAKVGRERYDEVRIKVRDLAVDAVKDIAATRDKAFTAYCVAEQAFNKHWESAWAKALDKVLAEEDIDE